MNHTRTSRVKLWKPDFRAPSKSSNVFLNDITVYSNPTQQLQPTDGMFSCARRLVHTRAYPSRHVLILSLSRRMITLTRVHGRFDCHGSRTRTFRLHREHKRSDQTQTAMTLLRCSASKYYVAERISVLPQTAPSTAGSILAHLKPPPRLHMVHTSASVHKLDPDSMIMV